MVAAFAQENGLANIVGTKTAGRLLIKWQRFQSGIGLLVGSSRCRLPNVEGKLIEGKGVSPGIPVELLPEELKRGEDSQIRTALQVAPRHVSAACHDLYSIIPTKVARYQEQSRSLYCVNLAANSEVQWQLLRLHLGCCALFLFPSCLFFSCPPGDGRLSGAFTSLLRRQFGGSDLSPF